MTRQIGYCDWFLFLQVLDCYVYTLGVCVCALCWYASKRKMKMNEEISPS